MSEPCHECLSALFLTCIEQQKSPLWSCGPLNLALKNYMYQDLSVLRVPACLSWEEQGGGVSQCLRCCDTHYRQSWLKQWTFISYSSGIYEVQNLVSAESPLADLQKHWCLLTFMFFVKTESPDVLPGSS